MKNLNYKNIILSVSLFMTFFLTFDLAIESYQESEPHAGNILFVASGIILLISLALYFKYKPQLKK